MKLLETEKWSHLLVLLRHADALEQLGNATGEQVHFAEAVKVLRLLADASDDHRIPALNRITKIENEHLRMSTDRGAIQRDIDSFFDALEGWDQPHFRNYDAFAFIYWFNGHIKTKLTPLKSVFSG